MNALRSDFSSRNPLRVGLVGSGTMGVEQIRNFAFQDEFELVALADPSSASREIGLETADAPIDCFDEVGAMLRGSEIDVVWIASPNFTHAPILDEVLDAPVHLVVEEPLCTTLEDCQHIVDRTQGRPGLFWVGIEFRFMPPVVRLIEELRAGRAGRLRMLSIRERLSPFEKKVGDWNRFNRYTGGALVETCCHCFDLMNLIVGRSASSLRAHKT